MHSNNAYRYSCHIDPDPGSEKNPLDSYPDQTSIRIRIQAKTIGTGKDSGPGLSRKMIRIRRIRIRNTGRRDSSTLQ